MEKIVLSEKGQNEMDKITRVEKANAAIAILRAIAEAIRELKRVPNGHLYARLMGTISYGDYTRAIEIVKNAGLVEEKNHELIWIGPKQ